MALYFFNLHECGDTIADEGGQDKPDMDAVREEACRSAREIMCAEVKEGRLCLSCNIEVKNEAGQVVMTVPFKDAITVTGM